MTSGPDALVALFNVLAVEEQEDAFERIVEMRLRRIAGDESEAVRFLRSLRRVKEVLGEFPSVGDYKRVSAELIAAGEDIETYSRLYAYYGSWPRTREALTLSDTSTPRRIEARFRSRRMGKVWKYPPETLRDTLHECAQFYGRPMTVREFDMWRERTLELARSRGDGDLHLPSPTPYRIRWGTWEGALTHHGFSPDEVAGRLQPYYPDRPKAEPFMPDGLPVAELRAEAVEGLPLGAEEVQRLRENWAGLLRRTRHILTVRLGLGGVPVQPLRQACLPLRISLDRVSQIHLQALDELGRDVAGDGATPRQVAEARDRVIEALKLLCVAEATA